MAEIVYGDQSISDPIQKLIDIFESQDWDGTLYIGYPILTNIEGTIRVDALYVSINTGVVVFDAGHLDAARADSDSFEEIEAEQTRFFAAINAKLLENPELLSRRSLLIPITIITLTSYKSFTKDDVIISTLEDVPKKIPSFDPLSPRQYEVLNSVIERTATIRPKKRRNNVKAEHSRGAILKEIESQHR